MFDALADYLLHHGDEILVDWRDAVRRDPTHPANRVGLDASALDDHLPSLLRMLGSGLRGIATEEAEKEGAEHGHQRRTHGYTVTDVLWEMTLFRRVLMAAVETELQRTPRPMSDGDAAAARLVLLDLLDRSVHASVKQYMSEAEAERDEARAQVSDTTARLQEANAQLKEAHVQKDRFLSVLSHELRNPLAPILSAVHVLNRLATDDPMTEPHRAIIERQARHLSRLVDDLLDLNRIAYGKLELRPEVVSLQTAVTFAVDSSYHAFAEKDVHLIVDIADEPIVVFADSTRVSQVVLNLLANAVKFTPSGGSVTVSLRVHRNEAELSVRDTGAGIPPEMLTSIFEPFEQGDTSLAHSSGGLGLGLMIARALVEAQGGKIEARSAGVSSGAEFVVRFPLSLSEPAAPAPGLSRLTEPVKPHRIALIEDNDDAREALATALRLAGHEVFTAGTADDGLEIARREKPDTFILDIGLPDRDGYALARTLRADEATKAAMLIALTGYGTETDRSRAREAGFNHHLTKPVDVERLSALLRE